MDVAGTDFSLGALLASTSGISYNTSSYVKKNNKNGNIDRGDSELYSLYDNISFMENVYTLGNILKDNNYTNSLIIGTTSKFSGIRNYYTQHEYYQIYDVEDHLKGDTIQVCGFNTIKDEEVYNIGKEFITNEYKSGNKFNVNIITMETHFPSGYKCEYCRDDYETDYENTLVCADSKLNDFMNWCKQQEWYSDTTIVIMGDHCYMGNNIIIEQANKNNYQRGFYNCFINSRINTEYKRVNRQFTQLDMFPTIISSLGFNIEGDKLGLGTNLFSDKQTIIEEYGYEYVNEQLSMNSKMYKTLFNISLE